MYDLDLTSDVLLSRFPPDRFAVSRLGISATRFAARTGGDGWTAAVDEVGTFRVVNLSKIGICLEGAPSLKLDERYRLRLTGPAGKSELDFYVLRCQFGADGYRMAGLFTELLDGDDLPA
jgi:hypothetical protein